MHIGLHVFIYTYVYIYIYVFIHIYIIWFSKTYIYVYMYMYTAPGNGEQKAQKLQRRLLQHVAQVRALRCGRTAVYLGVGAGRHCRGLFVEEVQVPFELIEGRSRIDPSNDQYGCSLELGGPLVAGF